MLFNKTLVKRFGDVYNKTTLLLRSSIYVTGSIYLVAFSIRKKNYIDDFKRLWRSNANWSIVSLWKTKSAFKIKPIGCIDVDLKEALWRRKLYFFLCCITVLCDCDPVHLLEDWSCTASCVGQEPWNRIKSTSFPSEINLGVFTIAFDFNFHICMKILKFVIILWGNLFGNMFQNCIKIVKERSTYKLESSDQWSSFQKILEDPVASLPSSCPATISINIFSAVILEQNYREILDSFLLSISGKYSFWKRNLSIIFLHIYIWSIL